MGSLAEQTGSQGAIEGPLWSGAAWSIDATSSKACPATSAEWTAFISSNSLTIPAPPTSLYLCQEAASPLADSIGAFPLAISGAGDAYQQSVTGWSRKACTLTDGTAGGWRSLSASLPDPASTSCFVLAYIRQPASTPAANRNELLLTGTTTVTNFRFNAGTPRNSITDGANVATGTVDPTGLVLPVAVKYDFTHSTCTAYTIADKLSPTFTACVGKAFYLGSQNANTPATGYLYAARWDGAPAELSDATVKALFQALGFSPTWS